MMSMSMAVVRRGGLLALAVIAALGAGLALGPVEAQSPGLSLELSLVEDSDNIVPPGGSVAVRATLNATSYVDESLSLSSGALRLNVDLEWESAGRARLAVAEQAVRGGGYDVDGKFVRFDGRTLIALGDDKIEVIDLETQEKVGDFTRPTITEINNTRDTTTGTWPGGDYPASATAAARPLQGNWGRAFDVWQEDADTAWLFVGSPEDNVNTHASIGRLYIYKVDYSQDPPTITLERNIEPQENDYLNDYSVADDANGKAAAFFGAGVAVSADGTTLAVTAREINEIGAVYVYERPGLRTPTHGPSGTTTDTGGDWADWGDLTQNSGTKLTPIEVPDWDGDGDTKMTTAGMGVPDSLNHELMNDCTAPCQRVWSFAYTEFGKDAVALSADGSVVVVGAQSKMHDGTFTPGKRVGYDLGTRMWDETWEGHFRNGEAYVFQLAASAGPRWKSSASMLAVDTGTNAHRLNAQGYGLGPGVQNFGARIAVSNDGKSVAVSAPGADRGDAQIGAQIDAYTKREPTRDGRVYVFNRSGAEWPQSGLTNAPGATLRMAGTVSRANGNEQFGGYGVAFRADGQRLAVAHEHYGRTSAGPSAGGAAWIFSGTSGAWQSADTSDARGIGAPTPSSVSGFGYATYAGVGDRLAIGGGADSLWLFDGDLRVIPNTANGGVCVVHRGEDDAPRTDDDTVVCELLLPDSTIVIPAGLTEGTFTISGTATINEQTYADALVATIGRVDELAQVEFDFATDGKGTVSTSDDAPYPDAIAFGETTTFRLRLLNEGGLASASGAAAAVRVIATQGTLSTTLGGGCEQSGGRVCAIPISALNAANSDNITVQLAHPGRDRTGTARVWAAVVSTSGKSFTSESRNVTFSGAPTTLAISAPSAALLGYDPDAGASDRRHQATLVVSATDKDGTRAEVPRSPSIGRGRSFYRVTVTGPDGRSVPVDRLVNWVIPPPLPTDPTPLPAKIRVEWPLVRNLIRLVEQDGNPQARVTIIAEQTAVLADGEYTLELRAGALKATRKFTITGGAAEIALSTEPGGAIEQGGRLTVTATVTDASGAAVPDGTPITFAEQSTGAGAVMVLLSPTMQQTEGGRAAVTLQTVGAGSAYVQATADGVSNVDLFSVVPPRIPAAELLTSTASNAYSVWLGAAPIMVSALLPELEGISEISAWKNGRWVRYGELGGLLVGGSADFPILPGEVVWLCAAAAP